jgi:hypothetical protein
VDAKGQRGILFVDGDDQRGREWAGKGEIHVDT